MSIEEQLRQQFQNEKASLHSPRSLDARIMKEYERHVVEKGRVDHMNKRFRFKKMAITVAVVALLCGFGYGGKLLYSHANDNFKISYSVSDKYDLSKEQLDFARASLKEVRSQLAPGETALVYLPNLFRDFPGSVVTNPQYNYDLQQWQHILGEKGLAQYMPKSLLNEEFQAEAGVLNNPFHPLVGTDYEQLIEEMKIEYNNGNDDQPIWRLADVTKLPEIEHYTTVYTNTDGEELLLSWQLVEQPVISMEGYASTSTEYEEHEINNKKVHYTKNHQDLLGESGVLQSATWITEQEGTTIIHYVETDSLDITKETLLQAVKALP